MESLDKNIETLAGVINKIGNSGTFDDVRKQELMYALKNSLQESVVTTMNTSPYTEIGLSAGAKATPAFVNDVGTITCSSFDCFLYDNTKFVGNPKAYTIPEATFELTDGIAQYVFADYNNGSPVYGITDDIEDLCGSCQVLIFKVWRVGEIVHSYDTDAHGSGLSNKIERSLYDTILYQRSLAGGLIISENLTPNPRTVVVSSGRVYVGATPQNVLDFDSSSSPMYEMVNDTEGWTQTQKSVYDNTKINPDGVGVSTMTDTYWATRWFYRSIGDDKNVFYTLGATEYATKAEAELEAERTDLPDIIKGHCLLVGRSAIQKAATSGSMSSPFAVKFTGTTVINHDDTGNISGGAVGEYNHLSNAELALALQAHVQNTDTKLDEGGDNEVAAVDIKTTITASHTHSNKSTLDNITAAFTTALKSSYDGAVSWVASYGGDTHTHSNKSTLDNITAAFTTALKSSYDSAVSWISTNGTNLINHLSATGNVHSLDHNSTNNKQGGTTAEYYHLTSTQHTDKIVDMKFGDVAGGNFSQFESDGTLVMNGTATYWKDVNFPIIIRTSGGNIPALTTFVGNLTAPTFAVNDYTVLEAQELVHEWKVGSNIYFHVHIATNGTNTTDRYIKFELEYTVANINTAYPVSNTVVTTSDLLIPANTAAKTHLLFSIATASLPSNTIGGQIITRLKRVASTGTAPSANPFVLNLQAHVECDTIGSRQLVTK